MPSTEFQCGISFAWLRNGLWLGFAICAVIGWSAIRRFKWLLVAANGCGMFLAWYVFGLVLLLLLSLVGLQYKELVTEWFWLGFAIFAVNGFGLVALCFMWVKGADAVVYYELACGVSR
ncbi:hypothetical protein U1Q18_009365 [Sarracenia purpurea var. burkii]